MNNNFICIGKITKPHGIRGQIKVMSYTNSPKDLFSYPILFDQDSNEYKLKILSEIGNNIFIASFNNNSSRNVAESIAGSNLYITKSMLKEADKDEYYHHDLVGLEVLNIDKELIGKIIAVHNFGAGDLIEIQTIVDKPSFYLPFDKEYVKEVNLEKKYLIFDFESSNIST